MVNIDPQTVLLANHSTSKMPGIKTRLKQRDFKVLVSSNLIDTLSFIRKEGPLIVVFKPSDLPVPEYETTLIHEAAERGQRVILVMGNEKEMKQVDVEGSEIEDFYVGRSPGELMMRIDLVLERVEREQGIMRAMEHLKEQSITDFKTGVYNDRFIFRRLIEEFQRSDRHATVLSVIMIDLDGFKEMNDSMGHQFGDFVLQTFAKKLSSLIRKIDLPGRYGGDEFLIILPNTGLDEAVSIAKRLRSFLEGHVFEKDGNRAKLTISQGINTYSGDGRISCDELLRGADKAVFEAKAKGKNRVCLYPLIKG